MIEAMSFMNLNMVLSLVLFSLSLLFPLFIITVWGVGYTSKYIPALLLKYSLFFNVGCLFMTGFMGQLLYGPEIAACLAWGWSPFQYELAFSELCLGILGLISPIFYREFWLATIIGSVIWLLGGAGVHLYYLMIEGNDAILNASFAIGWNIFIAFWLIGLYIAVLMTSRQTTRCLLEDEPELQISEF